MTDAIAATHAELRIAERRIAFLEEALREIAITYEETEQTPSKLCAALYAVCRLAKHALTKSKS